MYDFPLFHKFPEIAVGFFGMTAPPQTDEECAKMLGFEKTAKLHQIHSDQTFVVRAPVGFETRGDGLITDASGLALSVRWADCQAFAVYAPKQKVIGVLHAGWKGMATKAITAFYNALKSGFDIKPEETFVGMVPSLCKRCADFSDPQQELPSHLHPFVEGKCVDLQRAANHELLTLGVPADQCERHPSCTRCSKDFWSYRRDNRDDARNFLIAGLL